MNEQTNECSICGHDHNMLCGRGGRIYYMSSSCYEAMIAALRNEIKAYQCTVESRDSELAALREQYDQAIVTLTSSNKHLNKNVNLVIALRNELFISRHETKMTQGAVRIARNEIDKLRAELEASQARIEEIKASRERHMRMFLGWLQNDDNHIHILDWDYFTADYKRFLAAIASATKEPQP